MDPGIGAAAGVLQSALDAWPKAMSELERPCDAIGDAGALMKLLEEADEVALDAFHEQLSRALYNAEAGCLRSGRERIHGWENPIRSQRYSYSLYLFHGAAKELKGVMKPNRLFLNSRI